MGTLDGKVVVFTGALAMKRSDASARATAAGATVGSGVTGNTTLVVVGANAGAKLDNAKAKGIEIWTEPEFLARVDGKPFCGSGCDLAAYGCGAAGGAGKNVNVCKGWDKDGWYCGKQGMADLHYGGFKFNCEQCGTGWMQRGWFCGCEMRTVALVDDQAKVRAKVGAPPVRPEVRAAAQQREGRQTPAAAQQTVQAPVQTAPVHVPPPLKASPKKAAAPAGEATGASALKKHRPEPAAAAAAVAP